MTETFVTAFLPIYSMSGGHFNGFFLSKEKQMAFHIVIAMLILSIMPKIKFRMGFKMQLNCFQSMCSLSN